MTEPPLGAGLRGAVDLSGLVRRAAAPEQSATGVVFTAGDADFTRVLDLSNTVPVIVELTDDRVPDTGVEAAVRQAQGRLALARVDAIANPQLAQAFQVQQVPTIAAVIAGRPVPLFAGVLPPDELAELLAQVLQLAAQHGVTGTLADEQAGDEPAPLPPHHLAARNALEAGDYAQAIREYEQAISENPRDDEAHAALARTRLLARLGGADADEIDRRFVSGDVEGAFQQLLDDFQAADPQDRDAIRQRLLEFFEIAGPDDPRVAVARRRLASLLY